MQLPSEKSIGLDEAKNKALELINTTKDQAVYHIIANDYKGTQLQLLTYQEAISAVKNISISSALANLEEIKAKQSTIISNSQNRQKIYYWISDFQKNQTNIIKKFQDEVYCIPIIHKYKKNIYIDTAFIISQNLKLNQEIKLVYKVRKSIDDDAKKSLVTLFHNLNQKTQKEIFWNDNSEIIDTLKFIALTTNWQNLKLTITDASLEFDNEYLFSFYISPKPFVTLISENAEIKYLTNALKADDNYAIHSYKDLNLPLDEIQNSHLIILNQLSINKDQALKIKQFLELNKNIVIFLPQDAQKIGYSTHMETIGASSISGFNNVNTRIKKVNTLDPLLNDIFTNIEKLSDLPSSNGFYTFNNYSQRGKEVLISFENSIPFLLKYSKMGEGKLYVFSSLIQTEKSDFVYSSIFAPIMYKLGTMALNNGVNSYFIQKNQLVTISASLSNKDNIIRLVKQDISIIPPQRQIGNSISFSLDQSISEAGFYAVQNTQNKTINEIALNYSRDESKMEFLEGSQLSKILGDNFVIENEGTSNINTLQKFVGNSFWKLWIYLTLIMLAFELLILIFWDRISVMFKQ